MSGVEIPLTLPTPRLQHRWEADAEDGSAWLCHYELILPLAEFDVRREVVFDDDEEVELTCLTVPMGTPTRRTLSGIPCIDPNGVYFFDAPFRARAHAIRDAQVLGGLPVYCIAHDGTALAYSATPEPVQS